LYATKHRPRIKAAYAIACTDEEIEEQESPKTMPTREIIKIMYSII
jgi:hypothetical protein